MTIVSSPSGSKLDSSEMKDLLAEEDDLPLPDLIVYPRGLVIIPSDAEESDGCAWVTESEAKTGIRCLNGLDPLDAPWIPTYDATVGTRIMDAGGIILGKAACEAACMEPSSDTAWTGAMHNPYADGYSCGGSSSGFGRLVATGAVDMALGCDQGGIYRSVRIPAAFCGLVGLKATWGVVPYSGILGLHADIDHCGPMTKTVWDNACLLEAIAGPDGMDDRQPTLMPTQSLKYSEDLHAFLVATAKSEKPLTGFRVGVLKEGFEMPQLDHNIEDSVRSAIKGLAALGAEITEVSVPEHRKICTPWTCMQALAGCRDGILGDQIGRKGLMMTDRAGDSQPYITQARFDSLGPGAKNMYLKYLYVLGKYGTIVNAKATNVIRRQTRAYNAVLISFDALVMPTIPFPASKIFLNAEDIGPLDRLKHVSGTVLNTATSNATGHLALTLPLGFVPATEDKKVRLPAALQIVGKPYHELSCLKIAAAWERSVDWRERKFGL